MIKIDRTKYYYKLVRENLKSGTAKYEENKTITRKNNSLSFTTYDGILNYLLFGTKLVKLEILPDSKVYLDKCCCSLCGKYVNEKSYKTNKYKVIEITDLPYKFYKKGVELNNFLIITVPDDKLTQVMVDKVLKNNPNYSIFLPDEMLKEKYKKKELEYIEDYIYGYDRYPTYIENETPGMKRFFKKALKYGYSFDFEENMPDMYE